VKTGRTTLEALDTAIIDGKVLFEQGLSRLSVRLQGG